MGLPARFFSSAIFLSVLALFFTFIIPGTAHAQTPPLYPTTAQTGYASNFTTPNTDANVPQNQHYFTQSVLIETLSAFICQLAGIDVTNPAMPCLGINIATHKLGLPPQNSPHQVGGLIGFTGNMIGTMYTPTASGAEYFRYMANNFGIVKKTYAQTPANDGFNKLSPLITIWNMTRNVAYMFLILIFVVLGLGVMLRIHIDPRTVMTLQNQIPRIVICIMLITFSYAIAGILIDVMWLGTYAGINILTQEQKFNPNVGNDNPPSPLSLKATKSIEQTPMVFFNQIFSTNTDQGGAWGILHVTQAVAGSSGTIINDTLNQLLGLQDTSGCSWIDFGCWFADGLQKVFTGVLSFLVYICVLVVIFCVLIITLFRIWWELLKAYISVLIYTLAAPLYIVMGLLPGKPLGFEKWLRALFANLMVFPAVVAVFMFARIMMDVFTSQAQGTVFNGTQGVTPDNSFIPPLIGNPNMENFGVLLSFGVLLMAPSLLTSIRESLKVKPSPHVGALAGTLAAGAGAAAILPGRAMGAIFRRNPNTHQPLGPGSVFMEEKFIKPIATRAWGLKKWTAPAYSRREEGFRNPHGTMDPERVQDRLQSYKDRDAFRRSDEFKNMSRTQRARNERLWSKGLQDSSSTAASQLGVRRNIAGGHIVDQQKNQYVRKDDGSYRLVEDKFGNRFNSESGKWTDPKGNPIKNPTTAQKDAVSRAAGMSKPTGTSTGVQPGKGTGTGSGTGTQPGNVQNLQVGTLKAGHIEAPGLGGNAGSHEGKGSIGKELAEKISKPMNNAELKAHSEMNNEQLREILHKNGAEGSDEQVLGLREHLVTKTRVTTNETTQESHTSAPHGGEGGRHTQAPEHGSKPKKDDNEH